MLADVQSLPCSPDIAKCCCEASDPMSFRRRGAGPYFPPQTNEGQTLQGQGHGAEDSAHQAAWPGFYRSKSADVSRAFGSDFVPVPDAQPGTAADAQNFLGASLSTCHSRVCVLLVRAAVATRGVGHNGLRQISITSALRQLCVLRPELKISGDRCLSFITLVHSAGHCVVAHLCYLQTSRPCLFQLFAMPVSCLRHRSF